MKWGNLWKILRILSENAPAIIAVVEAMKHKDQAPTPRPPGPA
jgi:hypothetical protein